VLNSRFCCHWSSLLLIDVEAIPAGVVRVELLNTVKGRVRGRRRWFWDGRRDTAKCRKVSRTDHTTPTMLSRSKCNRRFGTHAVCNSSDRREYGRGGEEPTITDANLVLRRSKHFSRRGAPQFGVYRVSLFLAIKKINGLPNLFEISRIRKTTNTLPKARQHHVNQAGTG